MRVYLDIVGCRLNQAEIERFASQCHAAGYWLVPNAGEADVVIINTCTVTASAASDSRQKIRQAAHAGATNIVVTGCWATQETQEAAAMDSVTRVVDNTQKDRLIQDLFQLPAEKLNSNHFNRSLIPGPRMRTRAFIKAQDGCDNHCTFCITTIARGPGRSRSLEEILTDIQAACDHGENSQAAKEVVLTGAHLSSWGEDLSPPLTLHSLVNTILSETLIPRLRLSSLEPWEMEKDFFSLWENPRLCRHLHLPLQSGSAACLHRMARKTSPEEYAEIVAVARSAIPDIAITTDMITGFPGESEAEFQESLDFTRRMRFAGGHVFTFSARPGTAAARMPDQVPHPVRKERNARLRAILSESRRAYQAQFIGKVLTVLWESSEQTSANEWKLSGLTDNYLRVHANAQHAIWNRITTVKLTELNANCLQGQIQLI